MKLHLNLTLRRAVLAAMALVAVHTTQAQDIAISSPVTATPNSGIWNVGTSAGAANVVLPSGNHHVSGSIYIGGKGDGAEGSIGNNGTLTINKGSSLSASNSINVGNTQCLTPDGTPILGTVYVQGGSMSSQELTVGGNKGSGHIEVSGGGKISATDALKMGYYNSDISGSNHIAIDGAGSSLTVGEAGGNNDFTSIGTDTNGSISISNGASATFYDQTIIGENANSFGDVTVTNQGLFPGADPEATASSTLTLGTKTVLGLNAGSEGCIFVDGSKVIGTEMVVGSAGQGALSSNGGSTIDLKTLFLGQQAGSTGALTLSTGDKMTISNALTIGNAGTGIAYITGAELDITKNLIIGNTGTGTLETIGASAITVGGTIALGSGTGGTGEMTIGSDSTLAATGDIYAGNDKGTSTGKVTNEGKLTAANAYIMGADSFITNKGSMEVKDTTIYLGKLETELGGSTTIAGKLEVSGGRVTNGGTMTAGDTKLTNTALATGAGSNTTIGGKLEVAGGTVTNGGTMTAGNTSLTNATLTTGVGSTTDIKGNLDALLFSTVNLNGNTSIEGNTAIDLGGMLTTAENSSTEIKGDLIATNAATVSINGTASAANTMLDADTRFIIGTAGDYTNSGNLTGGASITNNGKLTNNGTMMVGGMEGSGNVTNNGGWIVSNQSTTGNIENTGNITILGKGRIDATTLTGTGTTSIIIDQNALSTSKGLAVIELSGTENDLDGIKVIIDTTKATALVGREVDFVEVAGTLQSLSTSDTSDDITITNDRDEEWEIDWSKGTITFTEKGSQDNTKNYSILNFTTNEGDTEASITGIKFDSFSQHTKYSGNVETIPGTAQIKDVEIVTEIMSGDADKTTIKDTDTIADNKVGLGAGDTVQTAVISSNTDSNGNKPSITVAFSKDITSGGDSDAVSITTNAVTAKHTEDDGTGNQETKENIIDSVGYTMTFTGTSTHTGNGKDKAEMGFTEKVDSDGKKQDLGTVVLDGVTTQLKELDVIVVEEGANVTISETSMHSTHAVEFKKGSTITFENVDLNVGGTVDNNILKEVVVTDADGNVLKDDNGKEITHTVESSEHITTQTVIASATLKLLGTTTMAFEEIKDEDLPEEHIGTTTISSSTVEISEKAKLGANSDEANSMQTINITDHSDVTITGEGTLTNATLNGGSTISLSGKGTVTDTTLSGSSLLLVQNEDAEVENVVNVVVSNGSHLKGKGNLKKVHVDKDSTFTVGSSPGQFSASELTVDGVTNFYFITDSNEWDTFKNSKKPEDLTASAYDATKGIGEWGAISQLVVNGPVSLNGEVRFTYQKWDSATNSFVNLTPEETQAAREELGEYFTEGTSIQFVVGNTDQLTLGNGFWINEDTLPVLADGLEWDVTSLFSTGDTAKVTYAMIGDPNRIANTLLSAGSTVLDFGRLGEAQAILREKGTTRTWGSAIANFDSIDSKDGATGYDYNAWGGAVGVDHAFTDRTVVGIALGRTYGENEAKEGMGNYEGGSIDQDATMVGLYGTHKFKTKGIMNDVKFKGFAAYGWFENESTRDSLKNNRTAEASWDSNAWVLSASLSRDITTDNDIVCSTYVGVEYTKATMDDFEESNGKSTASYTADEDYSNLAVKVGMTVSKSFGGFTPYVGIAYIHDVKRDVPEVTASNGRRSITGEGCMPGRGAVQIKAGANWQLSETLDIFAGYSAEIRDNATEHNANLGMGLTF